MPSRRMFALWGATIALALTLTANAQAVGTQVTVRIEGKSRTLLPTTVVRTHAGSITKGGTPAGACPASSAAGALDAATHRWTGTYSSVGIEITQILGETHTFSKGSYWSIWVDNRYAAAGICDLKLHRGEQLLFAPYPAKGTVYPIVLTAPKHATTNHPFTVKAFYYNGKGKAKPLAGVRIKGAGTPTNRHGIATITATHAGKLELAASRSGYIRSGGTTVRVS